MNDKDEEVSWITVYDAKFYAERYLPNPIGVCSYQAFDRLAKLQAENAKLRECVEFYADATNNPTQYMRQGYLVYNLKKKIFIDGGERARQVLKELGEK